MPQYQDAPTAVHGRCQRGDIDAAALQYVRKISGFRSPAAHNAAAFDAAVTAVADATRELLAGLVVSGLGPLSPAEAPSHPASASAD